MPAGLPTIIHSGRAQQRRGKYEFRLSHGANRCVSGLARGGSYPQVREEEHLVRNHTHFCNDNRFVMRAGIPILATIVRNLASPIVEPVRDRSLATE